MTFRLSPNSPKNGALGDRALQHRPTSLLSPAGGGGQGVVTLSLSKGCPAERLETVPYNLHYMLAEKVDIVGTVPFCRDCRVTFSH